jgi:hypothetical protein
MAGVRKNPNPGGKYHGWFFDAAGGRRFFTGTRSMKQTLAMAERFEDDHRQVRLGDRPAAGTADRHRNRPVQEVMAEYLAWGEAQGGRGGRPWSQTRATNRRTSLGWWRQHLDLETLGELVGILPRAEQALRDLLAAGRARKTAANRAESLRGFCEWAR